MRFWRLRNLRHRIRGVKAEICHALKVGTLSTLCIKVQRADGSTEDLGLVSRRVVTTAGCAFLVDAFQNLTEIEAMNYHAMGTGGAAEDVANTTLGTEVESRVAGTQSEPSSVQYRTVATIAATAPRVITEHGIFSASSAGTLWDRSLFSAINLATGDSIQFTYTLTVTAGG